MKKPYVLCIMDGFGSNPGVKGNAIEAAKISLPKYGGNIKETFFLPSFNENFDIEKGQISNEEFDNQLREIVANFSI